MLHCNLYYSCFCIALRCTILLSFPLSLLSAELAEVKATILFDYISISVVELLAAGIWFLCSSNYRYLSNCIVSIYCTVCLRKNCASVIFL